MFFTLYFTSIFFIHKYIYINCNFHNMLFINSYYRHITGTLDSFENIVMYTNKELSKIYNI